MAFRVRGKEKRREREKNIHAGEKHLLVAPVHAWIGDYTHTDRESNPRPGDVS